MRFRITLFFVLLFGVGAFVTTSMEKGDTVQATQLGQNVSDFVNTIGNPTEVSAQNPTLGSGEDEFAGKLGFSSPVAFIRLLGETAGFTSNVWEPWTAPFRMILSMITAVFLFIAGKELWQFMGGLLTGVGGVLGRVAGI